METFVLSQLNFMEAANLKTEVTTLMDFHETLCIYEDWDR